MKEKTGEEVSFTEREKPTEEPEEEPIPIKDDSYVHGLQNRRRELYQDIDELDREWNKINDMPERNNADKAAKREAMQDREPEIISQKKAHRLELRDVKAKLADVPTKEPKSEEVDMLERGARPASPPLLLHCRVPGYKCLHIS